MREIDFNDAQQALGFIVPQQLRIETEVYQTQYPAWDFGQFLFVDEGGDMWDVGSLFYSGDIAGAAQFLSGSGFDMPYADISRAQFLQQNHFAGIGYEWFLQELKRAEKLGRDLSAEKAGAATEVANEFKYGIAMRGVSEKGTTGLINDGTVPTANVAATGTGASTLWSTKTPDQILADVNEILTAPFIFTRERRIPNTLVLPTTRSLFLNSARLGTVSKDTILGFIAENNMYTRTTRQPLNILFSRELETAGAGGTARMMAYDNNKSVLRFYLPGDHTFLPVFQKSSMTWAVDGIMNIGGTEFRLPGAAAYRDGV